MLYFMLWNSPVRRSVSLQFKENVVTFDFYRKTFDVRCGSTARPRNSAVSLSRSTTATAWSEVKAADLEFPRLNDATRHASKRPKKRESSWNERRPQGIICSTGCLCGRNTFLLENIDSFYSITGDR